MNCQKFQNQIYEYLDESLSPRTQASAERHLAGCFACRQALRRQRQLAKSLSDEFRLVAESLKLPPEIGRRVQAALDDKLSTETQKISFLSIWHRLAWPMALAATGIFAIFMLAGHFLRTPDHTQNSAVQDTFSIDICCVEPTYTFRREGSRVIDSLTFQTNAVSATFWISDDRKPESKSKRTKLSL